MTEKKTGRGRPKGSGIDDTKTLQQMAARIKADPDAKRTTVIKDLGITNPSHIRRLRDKFAELENELLANAKPLAAAAKKAKPSGDAVRMSPKPAAKKAPAKRKTAEADAPASANVSAPAKKAVARVQKKATKAVTASKKAVEATEAATQQSMATLTAAMQETATAAASMGRAHMPQQNEAQQAAMNAMAPFAMMPWMQMPGLDTAVTRMVEGQMSILETAVRSSPFAAFLRQQAMMMDMALSMMKSQQQWVRAAQKDA